MQHAVVFKAGVPGVPSDELPGLQVQNQQTCTQQWAEPPCSTAEQGDLGVLSEALASCAPLGPEETKPVEDNSNKFLSQSTAEELHHE